MFLLIDNYDSFTYNLVQAFMQLGKTPLVLRNDDPRILELAQDPQLEMACISPGPGNPNNAGLCLEFLKLLPARIPVLGVCLGHQILGAFAGAEIKIARRIMHGKQSSITHDHKLLFEGLPNPMTVGRYHSLLVEGTGNPNFTVAAQTAEGECMALRYNDRPWFGVQFHPESVLTPEGSRLLENFPETLPPRAKGEKGISGKNTGVAVKTGANKHIARGAGAHGVQEKTPFPFSGIVEALAKRQDLSEELAHEAFSRLMDGELTPSQAGALLLGLRSKGETPIELAQAMKCVLDRAVEIPRLNLEKTPVIDVVGTGGDGRFSFNCSTATALTLAGLGHKVLKHGNRSVSSRCGSADVLEELGLPVEIDPEDIAGQLGKNNFVFLFAPRFHPSFRHVMPIRRELGVRTMFNILGPLVNPARPSHMMLGVPNPEMLPLVAGAMSHAGNRRGAVVCGAGNYDELTPIGPARVIFVEDRQMRPAVIDPAEYGFAPCTPEDLAVSDPQDAAAVLRELLSGKGPKAMRDMLAFNVGLALHLLKPTQNLKQCMKESTTAVVNGAGKQFAQGRKIDITQLNNCKKVTAHA